MTATFPDSSDRFRREGNVAAIALGGNLGEVARTFDHAVAALGQIPTTEILARSRDFLTRPVGSQAGDVYRNGVVLIRTSAAPQELFRHMQRIEDELGRVRTIRWGPRTVDLDLLSYGHMTIGLDEDLNRRGSSPQTSGPPVLTLTVPHAACWYRRFVLDPWCDVAPEWQHPVLGERVWQLRERLQRRPLRVAALGFPETWRTELFAELGRRFPGEPSAVIPEFDAQVAEIVFVSSTKPPDMVVTRSVLLKPDSSSIELAMQIVSAAMDEPQPLESH